MKIRGFTWRKNIIETMNLFFTQVRNTNGSLITIPNSRIEVVENQTRDWSQFNQ